MKLKIVLNQIKEKTKSLIPKTKKGRIIAAIVATCALVGIVTTTVLYETGDIYTIVKDPDQLDDKTWHKWNKKKTKHASYVDETTYDGSNSDIPFIAYDIPFRSDGEEKGGDLEQMYNSNKELLKSVDQDFVKARMDKAEDYVNTIFNQSFRTVSDNSDKYIESVLKFYTDSFYLSKDEKYKNPDSEEEAMNLVAYASDIAEFYVDNNITATCEWLTDDSLFYRTQYSYTTRGIAKVTLTSKDHKKGEPCVPFKEVFGIDANYGEEIDLIVNIGFGAWYNQNDTLGIGLVEIDSVDHAAEILKISTY